MNVSDKYLRKLTIYYIIILDKFEEKKMYLDTF